MQRNDWSNKNITQFEFQWKLPFSLWFLFIYYINFSSCRSKFIIIAIINSSITSHTKRYTIAILSQMLCAPHHSSIALLSKCSSVFVCVCATAYHYKYSYRLKSTGTGIDGHLLLSMRLPTSSVRSNDVFIHLHLLYDSGS